MTIRRETRFRDDEIAGLEEGVAVMCFGSGQERYGVHIRSVAGNIMGATYARALGNLLLAAADDAERVNAGLRHVEHGQ